MNQKRTDQLMRVFRVYAHYLKNWLKYFPRENILFVDGEQTLKRPYEVFEKAQRFLNIKTYLRKEHFVINNSVSSKPRKCNSKFYY